MTITTSETERKTQMNEKSNLPSGAVPFYLVIDTSLSMQGMEQEVKEMILDIIRQAKTDRKIGEIAHLGIVTFNSAPRTLLPMTALSSINPEIADNLVMEGGTMTGAALRYVKKLAEAMDGAPE